MPFHIPTLDEARNKHDTSAKTLANKKPLPKNKPLNTSKTFKTADNRATNLVATNKSCNSSYDNSIRQQQQHTKPLKVTNPYAKKRKLVSDDTSKNNAASAPTGLASTGPKSNTMTMTVPVSISHDTRH